MKMHKSKLYANLALAATCFLATQGGTASAALLYSIDRNALPWPNLVVLDTDAGFAVPHVLVTLLTVVHFIGKVIALCWLNLMIRWSLPRFRYDQIMKLCWRYMLPLALINVLLTGSAILLLEG